MEGVIELFDHIVRKNDIPIGETFYYGFRTPPDILGVTEWPISLRVRTKYSYIGDVLREAMVFYSFSPPPFDPADRILMGSVPMSDGEDVIAMENDTIAYIGIEAVAPSSFNDLTIEIWGILTFPDSTAELYGGNSDAAPNYFELHDDCRTVWLEVTEGAYVTFLFDAPTSEERWFQIDLKTAEHDLVLYGKREELPTAADYDWRSDGSNFFTGTVVTSQQIDADRWYIRVYGEDILFFTESATFRVTVSFDADFLNGAFPVSVSPFVVIAVALYL